MEVYGDSWGFITDQYRSDIKGVGLGTEAQIRPPSRSCAEGEDLG